MEQQPLTVPVDASLFYCAFCRKSLKLPTFKCDAGHVVCEHCCAGHLRVCTDAVNKQSCVPCPDVDRMILAVPMVPCVHKDSGCTVRVPHHESAEHLRSCPFVPCKCPSTNCRFTASPAELLQHFEKHEFRVVRDYFYGQPCELPVPCPGSLAALAGESDGCVFVVYGSPLGHATAVSVVCLRASEDAPEVARQFSCRLWVKGGRTNRTPFVFRVPSSDGARLPAELGLFVYPELPALAALMIRIHKDGAGSSDEDGGSREDEGGSTDLHMESGSDDDTDSTDLDEDE